MSDLVQALLTPRGVALVGASADPSKNTGRPQRFLAAHGYKGAIYPVNPSRDEVQGLRAYKSVADIDGPCDQAFIMVPADYVIDAVRQCGEIGVKVATIYSDGFAETGAEGQAKQDELLAVAAAAGVRILGPNSMGVICPASRLTLSVNAVLEMDDVPVGRMGLVSQSGTILGTLLSRGAARGIGYSRMLSVGNEADVGVGELVDVLVDDPETDAILLFLEALRDAPVLARAARRAFDAGKPVMAYKLGRSKAGQAVALSHSGALAGEDKAVDAFFRANGIVRIETLETLFEMPPLLMGQKPPKGKRVGVMTTTGGGASTVVDRLGAAGLDVIPAPEAVHERLKDFNLSIGRGPLIDLTMAGTREGVYGAALEALLESDACDAVVCVVGSSAQFHPELAVAPIVEVGGEASKPVSAFMVPQADASLRLLADAGIAAFRTPEACADAMRAFFQWRAPAGDAIPANASADGKTVIPKDEAESLAVFASLGVPVAPHAVISGAGDAHGLSYPLAVKALSADLPHKTEAGAVKLGMGSDVELADAIDEIRANVAKHMPDLTLDRFLVEEMVKGVGEVLVGFRLDPQVGPVVVLSPGGILAEVYGDSAIRMAPVSQADALAMIDEVQGLAPLRGYRNLPKGDLAALADAIVKISSLATIEKPPLDAEINPMIVCGEGKGVFAVDGLVITAE
ncbi:MAG: acetate--CoA ligase family protein [Rhodospirillales bacterium]|nr:acetate--CoA ligase family protein [Rhodospirillales bacterium]MBO6788759.1 acetate--CoA ligase family protein [Rhodospirillales bacterium]